MSWLNNNGFIVLVVVFAIAQQCNSQFQGCDTVINVRPGTTYLESPYYPNQYAARSSCRYRIVAPLDHTIQMTCQLNLPANGNACTTDFFYIARDGDVQLRGSEQLCGSGSVTRISLFRHAVLAYISNGGRGSFRCTLNVQPQPCDCGWYANTRIVNGQQANINEYPSMAYLSQVGSGQNLFCGASIISHYHALTAAHCALVPADLSTVRLNVGDHDLTNTAETLYAASYGVSRILSHPNYQQNPDVNDIAIVFTSAPIEWSRGVGPICLPPATSASNTWAYTYADVLGWGTTSFAGRPSNTLQKVTLQIMSNQDCQNTYRGTQIFASHMCTYDYTGNRRDSCQLDSGGPVIRRAGRQFLLGLISFGDTCGQTAYATGVNTRVSSYLQWIKTNTGSTTCNVAIN